MILSSFKTIFFFWFPEFLFLLAKSSCIFVWSAVFFTFFLILKSYLTSGATFKEEEKVTRFAGAEIDENCYFSRIISLSSLATAASILFFLKDYFESTLKSNKSY